MTGVGINGIKTVTTDGRIIIIIQQYEKWSIQKTDSQGSNSTPVHRLDYAARRWSLVLHVDRTMTTMTEVIQIIFVATKSWNTHEQLKRRHDQDGR